MARAIQRLIGLLIIDEGLTDFPSFAEEFMRHWGARKHRERVSCLLRDFTRWLGRRGSLQT